MNVTVNTPNTDCNMEEPNMKKFWVKNDALTKTLKPDHIDAIQAIQVELKERRQKVEEFRKKPNFDWNADGEKLQEENRKLLTWYNKAMAPFETKKQENLKNFKEICYNRKCNDLEMHVSQGGMNDREINIYKDWDREKVKKLQELGIIDYNGTYLRDILKHYDGIHSCDLEKVEKISQLKGFFLLSVLDDLNKVNISEKRLNELQDLEVLRKQKCVRAPFIIDNAKIFDDKYKMSIDLIKDAIQTGAVELDHEQKGYGSCNLKKEMKILSYSAGELRNMIKCHKNFGTVFYGDYDKEKVGKEFEFDNLEEIQQMFSCSADRIDLIAGQKFNMERLRSFKGFLQEHKFKSSMSIQEIIDLTNLGEVEYEKVCENLLLLQKVGISFDGGDIKFLSSFSKEWVWEPNYRVEDVSGCLRSLKIYPLLEICYQENLVGGESMFYLFDGGYSLLFNTLVKKNYDPKETDPEKLKQSLKIDRAGLKKLQEMEIYPNLEFFCKRKEKNDTYQVIGAMDTEINVQNFERINKIYPLKNIKIQQSREKERFNEILQNIQKDCLTVENIVDILSSKFDNSDYKINVSNIIPYLPPLLGEETYTIYNTPEKEWDITQALKIMEKFVQANPQLKIREE